MVDTNPRRGTRRPPFSMAISDVEVLDSNLPETRPHVILIAMMIWFDLMLLWGYARIFPYEPSLPNLPPTTNSSGYYGFDTLSQSKEKPYSLLLSSLTICQPACLLQEPDGVSNCCEIDKEHSVLVGHHLLDCLLDAMYDPYIYLLSCQWVCLESSNVTWSSGSMWVHGIFWYVRS
jgi:hypothetical protein